MPTPGKIVWYYQHLIDHWDLDHPFERLLVDTRGRAESRDEVAVDQPATASRGERRKVVTGIPGKTRHRLHARSRDRRVPVGASDDLPERGERASTAQRARSQ